ncbi:hypothetical protein [Pleomorphochaeta sp. DL1XJH-081]|uniref:hypothetical protein n=1 Tax=Pleomorphochaeta sp. DL1XJH-081 TaxID=3409690 RepID=UPI003BB786BB
MERQTLVMLRSGVLAVVLSLVLYRVAASSTLFIVPLLFFAPQFRPNRLALLPVVLVALFLIGSQLVGLGGFLQDISVAGALVVAFFMPLSLLVGAGIWIGLQMEGMLKRLLFSSSFAAIIGIGLLFWLSGESESAIATANTYKQIVEAMVPSLFGDQVPLGMDAQTLFNAVVSLVKLGFLPIFIGQFGLSVLISELLIHRAQWSYQDRMARWHLPEISVWIFLGGWTVVLATLVVDMPVLESLAWNIALSATLLYMVQGVSILAFLVRKRNPGATATRIFFLSFLLVMLPGVNVIPLAVLPLLGVSETWIGYRKIA